MKKRVEIMVNLKKLMFKKILKMIKHQIRMLVRKELKCPVLKELIKLKYKIFLVLIYYVKRIFVI